MFETKMLGQNIWAMSVWLQSSYKRRRPGAFYQDKPEVTNRIILQTEKCFFIEPSQSDKFPQLPLRGLPNVWDAPSLLSSQYLHWCCRNPQASHHPLACGGAACPLPSALRPLCRVRTRFPSGTRKQASTFVLGCESNCKIDVKRKKSVA